MTIVHHNKSLPTSTAISPASLHCLHVPCCGCSKRVILNRLIYRGSVTLSILSVFHRLFHRGCTVYRVILVSGCNTSSRLSVDGGGASSFYCHHITGTGDLSLRTRKQTVSVGPLSGPYIAEGTGNIVAHIRPSAPTTQTGTASHRHHRTVGGSSLYCGLFATGNFA